MFEAVPADVVVALVCTPVPVVILVLENVFEVSDQFSTLVTTHASAVGLVLGSNLTFLEFVLIRAFVLGQQRLLYLLHLGRKDCVHTFRE